MSACKSCGAEILWAVTPNGRRMPLDAPAITRQVTGYVPHWVTCPSAEQHRRGT